MKANQCPLNGTVQNRTLNILIKCRINLAESDKDMEQIGGALLAVLRESANKQLFPYQTELIVSGASLNTKYNVSEVSNGQTLRGTDEPLAILGMEIPEY